MRFLALRHDQRRQPHEELEGQARSYGCLVHRASRPGRRLPRPERRRQIDHDEDDRGPGTPSAGSAVANGTLYRQMRAPLTKVGVLLDAEAVHSGRSARNLLRAMAATHGIAGARVDEVIELTGIASVADKRAGGFSLGMGQRLGIAAALLGDPEVLILDEPINGLDPEGVLLVRRLVRRAASERRTVLLSSHLMSEMTQAPDHIIVLGRERVLADAPLSELVAAWTTATVKVRTPRLPELPTPSRARMSR